MHDIAHGNNCRLDGDFGLGTSDSKWGLGGHRLFYDEIPLGGTHAAIGLRVRLGTRSSNDTGTCRHTCIARTTVVAKSSAPTATWATVETTIGSSGWTASRPQATRVRNAIKPRHSWAISSETKRIAGRRTASIFENCDSARMAVQVSTKATTTAFARCGHQLMPWWRNIAPRIS